MGPSLYYWYNGARQDPLHMIQWVHMSMGPCLSIDIKIFDKTLYTLQHRLMTGVHFENLFIKSNSIQNF